MIALKQNAMMNKPKAIPDGYHTVTPYLSIKNAASAIDFYKKAFNAKELFRMADPSGKIGHAELQIGDSKIMLSDEFPGMSMPSPQTVGGASIGIHLYVENVDALFKQAVAAGAKVDRPVSDQFYGDRLGKLTDPFGHTWSIATHIEDVGPEELKKRAAAAISGKQ